MANEEHFALLQQGTDVWNEWRKQNPDIQPDLHGVDLRESSLMLVNLSGVDLSYADLSFADLSFADLSGADLSYAILSCADLSGSNLREAVFYKAIVCEATLCGADLRRGVLREATLSGSDFSGVDLREAVLYEAALDGVDLHQVRVEQALFGHHPGLTAIEQSNLEVNLRAKGAIFQTFFDSTAVSPSHSFGRNGSAKFQPSDRVQDKHQTQAKQSYEEDIFSLPDNVDDSSLYEETYTIPEGLTESLFGNTLYISVKSVRPDSISFELGSLGYPNKEIDSVTVGYRIIYINKFDICLVSANDTDATFVVNRVEAPNPVN